MIAKEPVWQLPDSDTERQVRNIIAEQPVPEYFARMLVMRDLTSMEQAEQFINPSLDELRDPFLMKDMNKAVERLKTAMNGGERMTILGDYDVDGVCGTSLFIRVMSMLGVKVSYHVPDRFKEGYGVSVDGIDKAIEFGSSLVISVDSGITAIDEADYARSKGIDLIITDHHEPQLNLPNAIAVLDPKRDESTYPFRDLAGVGVMFKLLEALFIDMNLNMNDLYDELDLVALGTAADVVPLVDENRILTKFGIERMRSTANTGLAALMEVTGGGKIKVNSNNIIYLLAPRLNAPGRLSSASKTVDLLISENWLQALDIAEDIERENAVRREMNDKVYTDAELFLRYDTQGNKLGGIVLASEEWHQGVIGIAASRLVEKYYMPTVLISLEDGIGKGSARSIKEFDICAAMSECEDVLDNYGGHKYAVGLSIQGDRIEEFRKKFNAIVTRELSDGFPSPSFTIDSEVDLSYINEMMLSYLDKLAPYGESNPIPLFLTRGVRAANNSRIVGRNHLKFKVTDGRRTIQAIAYNLGDFRSRVHVGAEPMDLLYNVELNEWMGKKNIQLVVRAIR